jgi:phosphatidylethanolamine-binding protein (PEBP) family uncharacterized protein
MTSFSWFSLALLWACSPGPPALEVGRTDDASDPASDAVTSADVTPGDAGALDATSADIPAEASVGPDAGRADASSAFTVTSTAFVNGWTLPVIHTCDGAGESPPLAWTGAPPGTAGYALLMTTLARDGLKWNWGLHSIPPTATALPMASRGIGIHGLPSDGPNLAYSPPCSRGPGPMMYTFTIYALSAAPMLPSQPNQVTGAVLTAAIRDITLASSAVTVTYMR